jgi:beta-glucosidase
MNSIRQSRDERAAYLDSGRPIDTRVKDLLERMTLEEKVAQMNVLMGSGMGGMMGELVSSIPQEELEAWLIRLGTPQEELGQPWEFGGDIILEQDGGFSSERAKKVIGESGIGAIFGLTQSSEPKLAAEIANKLQRLAIQDIRLGIPILLCEEGVHGHLARGATIFPQAIGMASTWNPDLVREIGSVIAEETRAVGGHQTYSPVLDLGRDPRWGRTEETYGEDPYLASRLAVAMVEGLQGESLADGHSIVASPKHFGGHGEPLGGRDSNMEGITERDLREIHLVPFQAAFEEAGALGAMSAYSMIDGIPCTANKKLLTEILREEWGFGGYVVSDYGAIEDLQTRHRIAATPKEAVKKAVEAGVDSHLGGLEFVGPLVELIEEGQVSEETVDRAVGRILRIKFLLGLFEDPYVDPDRAAQVCDSQEHRKLALRAAREAIVLLKNEDDLLPLDKEGIESILVTGPNADTPRNQLGDYSGWSPVVTVLDGIKAKVVPGADVRYVKGCDTKGTSTEGIAEAVEAARESDVAIVVVGGTSWTVEGTSGEGADRATLNLPGVQEELLKAVHETGTPVVVVLINGRPLTVNWAVEHVPAILEAWYPGEEGGNAVADVLFGDYNPGGKLPITFPRTEGQLPLYYNYKPSGRAYDYVFTSFQPLFEFGYGLSYTQFEYSNLEITLETVGPAGKVKVSVDVQNAGDRKGDEVVQLYLNDVVSSVVTPLRELKGFKRVALNAGEKKRVEFTLTPDHLSLLDRHLERVVESGTFEVMIGGLTGNFEVMSTTTG